MIEVVFTAPQKRETVERLTDAMVQIKGETMEAIVAAEAMGRRKGSCGVHQPHASGLGDRRRADCSASQLLN
ncbi:MAG TPA: hypothetical protein VGL51_00300 [Solirubrobacteraceae bacterium]